jgi:hypothetical protein
MTPVSPFGYGTNVVFPQGYLKVIGCLTTCRLQHNLKWD